MDEVRRFVRYTLPGLASALLLLIALTFTDGRELAPWLPSTEVKESIALVLGGLLASGALGYLFSVIYFATIDIPCLACRFTVDHRKLFLDLSDIIDLRDAANKPVSPTEMTQREAWATLTRFWFSKYETSPIIKGFNPYNDRLVDVMHGVGATAIGTIAAAIAWSVIHFRLLSNGLSGTVWIAMLGWGVLILAMLRNHRRIVTAVRWMAHGNMAELVRTEFASTGKKVTIWFVR